MNILEQLQKDLPLADCWSAIELFTETVNIGATHLNLAGVMATSESGLSIAGSAVESRNSPIPRAYYELVERSAVAEFRKRAEISPNQEIIAFNTGRSCTFANLFPNTDDQTQSKCSLSNGVALGRERSLVCQLALRELIERHLILLSWYENISPEVKPIGEIFAEFDGPYNMAAANFGSIECKNENTCLHVAGVFGMPTSSKAPLIMGMGCDVSWGKALKKAESECMQRLGFLWGEDIPTKEPEFSPTPEYHQDYYLFPKNHRVIEKWLNDGKPITESNLMNSTLITPVDFFDITPESIKGNAFVIKAVCEETLPLMFGYPSQKNQGFNLIHPMA